MSARDADGASPQRLLPPRRPAPFRREPRASAERLERGQFFTAAPVAQLALAALAPFDSHARVLDPTCGDGVFLAAARAAGLGIARPTDRDVRRSDSAAPSANLVGLDIDREAAAKARAQVPDATIIDGDLLEPGLVDRLGLFDLVIGNPPYVRAGTIDPALKRARAAVLQADWPELDRSALDAVARLADISASCLLRALRLTAPGGQLALVMSTALLDTDAAAPLWRLVDRVAHVRAIIVAPGERWFDDAAVNSMLVVAERRRVRAHVGTELDGRPHTHVGTDSAGRPHPDAHVGADRSAGQPRDTHVGTDLDGRPHRDAHVGAEQRRDTHVGTEIDGRSQRDTHVGADRAAGQRRDTHVGTDLNGRPHRDAHVGADLSAGQQRDAHVGTDSAGRPHPDAHVGAHLSAGQRRDTHVGTDLNGRPHPYAHVGADRSAGQQRDTHVGTDLNGRPHPDAHVGTDRSAREQRDTHVGTVPNGRPHRDAHVGADCSAGQRRDTHVGTDLDSRPHRDAHVGADRSAGQRRDTHAGTDLNGRPRPYAHVGADRSAGQQRDTHVGTDSAGRPHRDAHMGADLGAGQQRDTHVGTDLNGRPHPDAHVGTDRSAGQQRDTHVGTVPNGRPHRDAHVGADRSAGQRRDTHVGTDLDSRPHRDAHVGADRGAGQQRDTHVGTDSAGRPHRDAHVGAVRLLRLRSSTATAALELGLDAIATHADERRAPATESSAWAPALRAPRVWWQWLDAAGDMIVPLRELAEIRRGLTTGANDVFYVTRDDARVMRLEPEFLRPVVRSPFNGSPASIAIDPDDAPLLAIALPPDPHALRRAPRIRAWLKRHEDKVAQTSVGRRNPWWALPLNPARLFLSKAYGPRFVQRLAALPVLADQRVYGIHPKAGVDVEALAAVLNSLPTALALESLGRASLGFGAVEWTVRDAHELPVIDVRRADESTCERLRDALAAIGKRRIEHVRLERERPDRAALDDAVLGFAGGRGLVDHMWSALLASVALRDRYLLPPV